MLENPKGEMEDFEKYRKDFAEKLKNTPKEERKALIEQERNSEEYKKAKKLHQEKHGFNGLTQTEKLQDPNDPKEVVAWMNAELDDFLKPTDDPYYSWSFNAEELQKLLTEAAHYLARKLGVDEKVLEEIDLVSEKEGGSFGPEELARGGYVDEYASSDEYSINFLGEEICKYSLWSNEGWDSGRSMEGWNQVMFDIKCEELLKYLKQEKEEMQRLEGAEDF